MFGNQYILQVLSLVFFVSITAREILNPDLSGLRSNDDAEIRQSSLVPAEQHQYVTHLRVTFAGGLVGECAGTIISAQHILTAAHCVVDKNGVKAEKVQVTMRTHSVDPTDSSAIVRNAEKIDIIPHESFNLKTMANDIAILKVREYYEFSSVAMIPENDFDYAPAGTKVPAVGWSRTSSGMFVSWKMKQTYVTIGSNEDCLAKWGKEGGGYIGGYDPKTMMCTKTIQAFTCEGDNGGGPLVIYGNQIGIVSYKKTKDCEMGSVYTRISAYSGWIKANMVFTF